MGLFRVFRKGIRFTFRARKRFIVFMLIFAIISTLIAFYIDQLDDLQTNRFLEQNGVVMYAQGYDTVTYQQGTNLVGDIEILANANPNTEIEDYVLYRYADLDERLRIYSFDHTNPWYSEFVKPSLINDGTFPTSSNQALVPSGSFQQESLVSSAINVTSRIAVGQRFEFIKAGEESIKLEITGTFDSSEVLDQIDDNKLWLFVDERIFTDLLTFFDLADADSFTYGISFAVPGNILDDQTHKRVTELNRDIIDLNVNGGTVDYGQWKGQPDVLPTTEAESDRAFIIVNLLFIVAGGVVLSTMLSYLVSRFRSREIAILKAMGYSNGAVRLSLIAEIITTATVGFVVGIGTAQALLFYFGGFDVHSFLSSNALLISFAINVLVTLPGMLVASRRVLKVSPSEAFRDR